MNAKEKHGDKFDYSLIEPEHIQNKESKLPIICNDCFYFFTPTLHNHFQAETGAGCPLCSKKAPWTYLKFMNIVNTIHCHKYDYSQINPNDITGNESKLDIKCKCGYDWTTTIASHINSKSGCPQCAQQIKYTLGIFLSRASEIHIDINGEQKYDYSLITEEHIKNKDSLVPIKCKKCTKVFTPRISNFISKQSNCPCCKCSKGEQKCALYMKRKDILFEDQVGIEDLPRKKFDFLITHNGSKFFLEYDGEQHFRYTPFFNKTFERFLQRQEIDVLKTKAVLEAGHNIIRIDYTQINNVGFHIQKALELNQRTYFSDEELYLYITEEL